MSPAVAAAMPSRVEPVRRSRAFGALVVVESLLPLVPIVVLGAAIGWPGSLGDPAEAALPRLLEHEAAVRAGYVAYLAYSALFLPVAVVVLRWYRDDDVRSASYQVALGAAAVSAALRCIGIVRWLAAVFPLAERWAVADDAGRATIAVQFQSLDDFGGAVGELLGVSLFASVFLVAALVVRRPGALASRVRATGLLAALLVAAPLVELLGVDAGVLISVSSTAMSLWLLGVGIAMLRRPLLP